MIGGTFAVFKTIGNVKSSVHSRLDREGGEYEDKFVHKDVCKVTSEYMTKKLDEVSNDVKKLLSKNGLK